jgi:hypothetical protein
MFRGMLRGSLTIRLSIPRGLLAPASPAKPSGAPLRALVLAIALAVSLAACGPTIPNHNGYKSAKASPWRSPKLIKLDDNNEGKVDGELDYPSQRRAKWYAIDLPSSGDLAVTVEANPQNESNDFDLGMEILGGGNRVLIKADLDDEDAHELTKTRAVPALQPGRYLLHLFLQGRLDNSDYEVKVKFAPKVSEAASTFPAQVSYLPALALVPVIDDSPAGSGKSPGKVTVRHNPTGSRNPTPPTPPPPSTSVRATILRATQGDKATTLVLSAGSADGVADGWKGKIKGVTFTVSGVTQRTCKAVIPGVTAEQLGNSAATLSP